MNYGKILATLVLGKVHVGLLTLLPRLQLPTERERERTKESKRERERSREGEGEREEDGGSGEIKDTLAC